ncbi:MAG TPA: G8 domain-containing protein [Flavobacterium sp.]|nr:G8 domain-containing protein [Flavobacterium sp.]
MKRPLLLLLCFLAMLGYASSVSYGPSLLKSYFEKAGFLSSSASEDDPVASYPSETLCRANPSAAMAAPMLWSDSGTWASMGAVKPVAGSAVSIPAGVHVILDESPPALASLSISGKLEFADQDLNLTARWIMVMGTFQIGTPASPYANKAVITLNATNLTQSIMGMGTRGIMVMGGKLEMHGVPPSVPVTKLNENAAAGSTALTLADPVSWGANSQIVVATSDYYGAAEGTAQRTRISSASSSTSLTIQDGLNAQRWGKLQYLTASGMSLVPGAPPAGLPAGTPTVLDERAEVASLTRNIVVQSVDDALWQNNGFGCHIMIMRMNGTAGEAHLDGVEIRRGGQAGKLGRYPFHWHMLSYSGSTTLPDVTGQYIRNSVVNQSSQRGIVIHGTNGAEVSNNVVYDVRGHGIFTEDASERRNIINGNLVLKVRHVLWENRLKLHETEGRIGSSGFWISNPDNTITNNTAADCEGSGFWLAFPEQTFGASAAIQLRPRNLKFGTFSSNHAHSNQKEGIFLDNPEVDELGTTEGRRYASTSDMQEPQWPFTTILDFYLSDYTVWKNNTSGIWNASGRSRSVGVVSADNASKFFAGVGDEQYASSAEKSLVVGASLNYNMNGVSRLPYINDHVAFASYHSTFDIKNNTIVNFPAVQGETSGAFAIDDYYLTPVDKGTVRNPGNILINSHPGVRILPREPQFTFGVVWDPHNYWGGPASQDNYYVLNKPFLTYGQAPHVPQNNPASGGVVVNGPFYGFSNYRINGMERPYDKINVTRTNASGQAVGSWTVEAGGPNAILGNMRHFAAHPSGYYYLDFPTIDDVNEFTLSVSNMLTGDDYQVVSVEYSGDYSITQLFASTAYNMDEFGNTEPFPGEQENVHPYARVSSFQEVVDAPNGEVFWQDKINSKVWFKVRGGVNPGEPTYAPTRDLNLYKEFRIRGYGAYDPLVIASTTWNGTAWSNGVPSSSMNAIIEGNYNSGTNGAFASKELTVNSGVLTIASGSSITVQDAVKNNAGDSNFIIQSGGNLIQANNDVNTGSVRVQRNSAPIVRLDYTLWSSPVSGQNLFGFSPNTLANRFYTYDTESNAYVNNGLTASSSFIPGQGYAVRAPNNFPASPAAEWTGTFKGIPNNGNISFPVSADSDGYNLIGNPYPSAISAVSFVDDLNNAFRLDGTLYFYAHSMAMNASGQYSAGTNYATWNKTGYTMATNSSVIPNGTIQVGQGFIVKAIRSGDVNFTNLMRDGNTANQFFRTANAYTSEIEKHRIWLNLSSEEGSALNQILIGYVSGATAGFDRGYDGLAFGNTGSFLATVIGSSEYAIQARPVPFEASDAVPLAFKAATSGNYKIALSGMDGVFAGSQDIFLKDNTAGTIHNLKSGAYAFASAEGTFNSRFEIVYQGALSAPEASLASNSIATFKKGNVLHVETKNIEMASIKAYDVQGKLVYARSGINASAVELADLQVQNQVLLLQITSSEGITVPVKLIF